MGATGVGAGQKLFVRAHVALFRATGGRLGGRVAGLEQVLLTTTGRRSGQPRTVPLAATVDGSALVLVASNGGAARDPAWFGNLVADPRVQVQRGREVHPMVARVAQGEERARLWVRVVANNPGYERYSDRTQRVIPVVVCEPDAAS
ncbi:nitroreductase family deazaflavin-dependent oxidoreductase [Cellulomonas soli]|uniref:nitroreductase family deazaflavin-dependent oxidoreductase n=1 Tax=Cellulomonas soli TaxID=931535 RepID=UPI003F833837